MWNTEVVKKPTFCSFQNTILNLRAFSKLQPECECKKKMKKKLCFDDDEVDDIVMSDLTRV